MFKNKHVLIVEDDIINQKVFSLMIEYMGASVTVAENGKQALEILDLKPFNLILMDHAMPIMNGHEATIAIRTGKFKNSNLPIIAVTANTDFNIKHCLEIGMNDYLLKPIDIQQLTAMMSRYLN
jgi:CheY-like chemotaxis protein